MSKNKIWHLQAGGGDQDGCPAGSHIDYWNFKAGDFAAHPGSGKFQFIIDANADPGGVVISETGQQGGPYDRDYLLPTDQLVFSPRDDIEIQLTYTIERNILNTGVPDYFALTTPPDVNDLGANLEDGKDYNCCEVVQGDYPFWIKSVGNGWQDTLDGFMNTQSSDFSVNNVFRVNEKDQNGNSRAADVLNGLLVDGIAQLVNVADTSKYWEVYITDVTSYTDTPPAGNFKQCSCFGIADTLGEDMIYYFGINVKPIPTERTVSAGQWLLSGNADSQASANFWAAESNTLQDCTWLRFSYQSQTGGDETAFLETLAVGDIIMLEKGIVKVYYRVTGLAFNAPYDVRITVEHLNGGTTASNFDGYGLYITKKSYIYPPAGWTTSPDSWATGNAGTGVDAAAFYVEIDTPNTPANATKMSINQLGFADNQNAYLDQIVPQSIISIYHQNDQIRFDYLVNSVEFKSAASCYNLEVTYLGGATSAWAFQTFVSIELGTE